MKCAVAVGGVLLIAMWAAGCGRAPVKVYARGGVEVALLRSGGGSLPNQHPVEISAQRLSQILSAIQVQFPKSADPSNQVTAVLSKTQSRFRTSDDPVALIHPSLLPWVAEGLALALTHANADQIITVMALRKTRQLAVLNTKYLTNFIVYQRDGMLYFDLSRVDWVVPKNHRTGTRETKLPPPRANSELMEFRLLVVPDAIERAAPQVAGAVWQSPVFEGPSPP